MNRLTLAVAGSRKTQSIVNACSTGDSAKRRLALTFTLTGQSELSRRLDASCAAASRPEVMGWYAFLMRHWIRPFLPLHFPGRRLRGLNFDGDPGMYAAGEARFLDTADHAYRLHVAKLAIDVMEKSEGAVIDRMSRIYDEIYIDEVQDLTGCDLHVLTALMDSSIEVHMVGDVRQSVFDTNPRDPNLKQYRGIKMLDWFGEQEDAGHLEIRHATKTWRSNQAIADFSDTVFPSDFSFPATESVEESVTGHDGVFAITEGDAEAYVARFRPLCLRASKATARNVELPFMNFGQVKGVTADRVLIFPTGTVTDFLGKGTELTPKTACGLYVGVTRARHSVAFALKKPAASGLPLWSPAPA